MSRRKCIFALLAMFVAAGLAAAQVPYFGFLPDVIRHARLKQLFAIWAEDQAQLQTLSVEFTLRSRNPVFPNAPVEEFDGRLKVRKRADGAVDLAFELLPKNANNQPVSFRYAEGNVYLIWPDQKTILEIPLPKELAYEAFVWGFQPLTLLVDAKVAREHSYAKISKLDQWHSYLEVIPKSWHGQNIFRRGRIVLLNKPSESIPKNMPRQVFRIEPNEVQKTYDITKWQLNVPGTVRDEDVTKPRLPEGWEIKRADIAPWIRMLLPRNGPTSEG